MVNAESADIPATVEAALGPGLEILVVGKNADASWPVACLAR